MSAENAWKVAMEAARAEAASMDYPKAAPTNEEAEAYDDMAERIADYLPTLPMPPAFRAEVEAEAEELRKEIADLESWVIAFVAPWASSYGEERFGPGMMHPNHYDILERCGARMASFTRARLEAKGESHE